MFWNFYICIFFYFYLFAKSHCLAGISNPLAWESPTQLFEWLAVPASIALQHRPTHTFISAISLCAQTWRLCFVAPHLSTTSLFWFTLNDKRTSAASKEPILSFFSPFFTTQEGVYSAEVPWAVPGGLNKCGESPLRQPVIVDQAANGTEGSALMMGFTIGRLALFFSTPRFVFMVGPFPLLSWLMRRAAQVGQKALCSPGGATFCFWPINNANKAMVPSFCLDDRSWHLPFLSHTLLDLWRLPPRLAAEWQTSAHLAVSPIFMSALWGVNDRHRCRCLFKKKKKMKSNHAVSSAGARCQLKVRNGIVMESRKITGGQLVGSQLQILLICCKSSHSKLKRASKVVHLPADPSLYHALTWPNT